MSRVERWLVHIANLLVGGTGVVYAVMLYLMESDDPFSVLNHPYQPHVQHLHVALAPAFVFAAGMIWKRHIWRNWRQGIRQARRSGSGLLFMLLPMIASGYFLQVTVESSWRQIWGIVHVATSGIWILAFVLHFVSSRRTRSKASAVT